MSPARASKNIAEEVRASARGAVKTGERLAPHTTIKIGGAAECWFEPEDADALARALELAAAEDWPVTVIGGGSNLLLPDEGVPGLVIHLASRAFRELDMDAEGNVAAGAAVPLASLVQFLVTKDRGDCEFLLGIPAQVGGAVMMNAGSATRGICENAVRVETVGFNGRRRTWQRGEISFKYRSSGLEKCVVTRAILAFPGAPFEKTLQTMAVYSEYRRKSQDLKFPNAGCMFRNPGGMNPPAGKLIEEAGLKGASRGGARISTVHANFVVNAGGASQKDVLELLDLAERTVRDRFHIQLHREIKVVRP